MFDKQAKIVNVKSNGGRYQDWATIHRQGYQVAEWGHLTDRQRQHADIIQNGVLECIRMHWGNL